MQTIVSIPGIHCPSCAALIKDVSSDFPAITSVDVDIETKRVTIEHDNNLDLAHWSQELAAVNPQYVVHPVA